MTEDTKEKTTRENLEAAGQIIIGEIEKIGGILTADPITQAEGDYNIEAGSLHHESAEALEEDEEETPTEAKTQNEEV